MPNQQLIDYENSVKQENLSKIAALNSTISVANQQITDIQADNVLIDEVILVLESVP